MTKISLIIPLYNGEKYLKECLDSVSAQTFTDFECHLIDDGSIDATPDIIAEYAQKDNRFKITKQANSGVSAARNKGMELSKSPYLMFLDQDDMFHPQALELLYKVAVEKGVDVAAFNFQTVDDSFMLTNPTHYDLDYLDINISDHPFETFFHTPKGSNVMMWVRIYKKEAIKNINFPADVQPAEDSVFTLKVFHNIKSYAKVELPLLFYRNSTTSVMNQGRNLKYLTAHLKAGEILYDYFLGSRILDDRMQDIMEYYIARFFYKTCLSQILRQVPNKKHQKEMLKYASEKLGELYIQNKFDISKLSLNKRLASKAFLRKHFCIAKTLI